MGISIKQSLTTVLDIHSGPFILRLLHSDSNSMLTRDQIDLNNILDGEHNRKHLAKAMETDNLNSNMQTKKRNKNPTTTNTPTKQSLSSQISTKNTSITNGGEDLSTPGANTTIELTANMVVTEEDPDMHHKTMEGQPARDCAADHPKWRKLKA